MNSKSHGFEISEPTSTGTGGTRGLGGPDSTSGGPTTGSGTSTTTDDDYSWRMIPDCGHA